MAIQNLVIGTTPSAFYTSVGDSAVTCVYLCNTSNSSVTFSLHAVPAAGTPSSSNRIYDSVTLTAKDTYVIDMEKLVLSNGDALYAAASQASAITVTISAVTI